MSCLAFPGLGRNLLNFEIVLFTILDQIVNICRAVSSETVVMTNDDFFDPQFIYKNILYKFLSGKS